MMADGVQSSKFSKFSKFKVQGSELRDQSSDEAAPQTHEPRGLTTEARRHRGITERDWAENSTKIPMSLC
jgi:hypothetical protein